jgi:3-oxoadipate enol-lactonase
MSAMRVPRGRTGHVPTEGGRLYYERAGRGPGVVLIHPGLWDSRVWDDQFGLFSREHDVIRYDLRGFGRSDPPSGPYSHVQDLLELLVFLDVERATLVGESVGGTIAVDFAIANPEMVSGLVLVGSGLSGHEWEDPGMEMLREEVAAALRDGRPEAAVAVSLAAWTPLKTDPVVDERIRRIAHENASAFLIPDELVRREPPAEDRLSEIAAPTLVILGEQDIEELLRLGDLLAERIPGAQKRVIAGADHIVNMRAPEKFNRTVLDFLALIELRG